MNDLRESAALLGLSVRGAARASDVAYLKLIEEGLPVTSLERVAAAFAPSESQPPHSPLPPLRSATQAAPRGAAS